MVSECKEKKPNYFRFICESILGNLTVTVFHSGHFSHLLKLSCQSYRRQKTLTVGNFFGNFFWRSPFLTPDHTIRCARRRSSSFVKAPEGDSQSHAGHARFFSGGLKLIRRRVEHFLATRFHLQPRLTPSSHSPSVFVPFEPYNENYLSWSASVELWFIGQGYEDHLVMQEADIPEAKGLYTNDIQRLYKVASSIVNVRQQDIDKFFMVLTLISLRSDLETVRDQILDSSSVPSLDDVFARLLLVTELHGRPPRTAHVAQSSDPQPPQPPSSSTSQGISFTDSEYDDYLCYQATKSASIASVAQTGNASACLTHTSSLGPWILDSGASDHISGNKDLFSSITTTFALPTVTLANGSQTMAKGIGLAHPLPSLPLTSVLYTPECSFNLISISKITRTLNCSITFSDKFVTLQDRSMGKTIGIGRESGLVCRLRRSLYDLKQFPRAWFSRFSSVVQEFDMFRSSDQNGVQKLKQHLFTHFQTKDLRKLKYFLGIEIAQSSSGVVLSQRKYALTSWKKPLPCDSHWDAIIRILRYIKSTPGQGVLYENRCHTQVVGYTDADWAGSPTDRRSTSGCCVFIGGNLISWKSKKQDVVAKFSAEVEYRAMTLATCEFIWLKHLLQELRFGKMNR
ncbi:putative mitochondrial protein [Vitis vinifera]|uniref:Putative mitochondrial protein n=1 Tax=Vitis vinifera TaxID=29760 RepID=A0A438GP91_VITVI|nr:putative mitochondrial protein [Vitis vinifera]